MNLDGGSWQPCGPLPPQSHGPHVLEARCTDACANVATNSSNFAVDIQAPAEPTITSPADGTTVGSSTVTTDITCAEGSCEERLDGGPWQACGTDFTFVADDSHLLEATCTDACGNTSVTATSNFGVDTQGPWVMFTSPGNGQTDVRTGVNIEIQFNEDMDTGSVESGFTLSSGTAAPLPGNFYWRSDDTVVFATPDLLTDYTNYTVDLVGATDLVGNSLMPGAFPFDFETGDCTPPQVVSKNPSGSALVDSSTLTEIEIIFNEPMDTTRGQMEIGDAFEDTVVWAGIGGPGWGGSLTWTDNYTLTLTLSTPSIQEGSGYGIRVQDLSDQNWNWIGDIEWSIVTQGPASDVAPPQLTLSLPFDGQTGVPRKLNDFTQNSIMLGFDETLDPSTITQVNITLTDSSGAVLFDIDWDVGDGPSPFTIMLIPDLPLNPLETYTIGISGGIEDSAGNSFISQSISFTTADESDSTPPWVEATLPGDGWIDLDWWGIDGEIGFNEAIDYSTVDISALTMNETDTGIPIKGLKFEKPGSGESTTWDLDFWSTRAFTGMKPNTQYTLTISSSSISMLDLCGNPLAGYSWTFTTVPEGPITGQPANRLPRTWDLWPDVNAMSFENGNVTIELGIGARDDDGDTLTVWVEDENANNWTLTEDSPGSGWYIYETFVPDDFNSGNEPLITYDGWQTFTFYIDDGQPGHTISVSNQVYIWPTADLPNQVSPIYGEGVTLGEPVTLTWQNVDTANAVMLVGQYINLGTGEEEMFFTFPTLNQTTLTGLTPGSYMWMVMQMAEVHGEIFEGGGVGVGYQGMLVSNFDVVDPTLGSISGTISYAGPQTGNIMVAAVTVDPVGIATLLAPGDYTLYNLPDDTYSVISFMDVDGDMNPGPEEPFGIYGPGPPTPVTILGGSDETGIDITLLDP